tara:strand:- start:1646 stop:2527 length:882 start_codon:yes stop_codon:yes gene_type:complete
MTDFNKWINKGSVNGEDFDYSDAGHQEAIDYATGLMRDKKKVVFEWEDYEDVSKSNIKKEGDGGGAASSGSFGDGGGTVFTSTDSGIFTPTYSDRGTRKKNKRKKRSGVDRLADFITDNSPERKMEKSQSNSQSIVDLLNWVRLELRKEDAKGFRQQNSGTGMNDQIPRIDWYKEKEEEEDSSAEPAEFVSEPSKQAADTQNNETKRIKQLDDEDDADKPQDTGSASQASPAGLNVQLAMPSAAVQYDSLGQGGYKDTKRDEPVEDDDIEGEEVTEPEEEDKIIKIFNYLEKF